MTVTDTPVKHSKEKLVRCRVARGRSIMVPWGEKRLIGNKENGDPVTCVPTKNVPEFQWLELPESDVLFLRERGYVMDAADENRDWTPVDPTAPVVNRFSAVGEQPGGVPSYLR
jgi:hypothetical protein